ncbi:MAG: M15 family metallopeptidase [Candidatus Saccharibacteria bacterium]
MKKYLLVVLLVASGLIGAFLFGRPAHVSAPHPTTAVKASPTPSPVKRPVFNSTLYSTNDPNSLWVITNKQHALNPPNYVPSKLVVPNIPLRSNITSSEEYVRSDTASALNTLFSAAKSEAINLNLQSGYRSYGYQGSLYNRYVTQQGLAVADSQSARPGYSEHQTGLAADLGGSSDPACDVEQCYASTAEGKWLAANSYRFGFIVRYPADKQNITGYSYEPWHIRYVGTELSQEMHAKGISTLEEFFHVTGGENY